MPAAISTAVNVWHYARMPPVFKSSWAHFSLLALCAGISLGFIAHQWPTETGTMLIGWLEPLALAWLSALRFLVIPLVISLLIPAIGRGGDRVSARLGAVTLFWFCLLLGLTSIFTLGVGAFLLNWLPLSTAAMAAFQTDLPATVAAVPLNTSAPALSDWLSVLKPVNLFKSLMAGNLVSVVIVSLMAGVALRFLGTGLRQKILSLLDGLAEWCMKFAGLLFRVMPVAIFILTLRSAESSGAEIAVGLAYYVFWISALLLLAILLLYPLTRGFSSLSMKQFSKGIWPAQVLAFSNRSSIACLPIMLAVARQRLRLPENVVAFVLPFAVSTFKLNMGVSAIFQMMFLLHVYSIQVDPATLMLAVAAIAAQSVATPGLPSGVIWTTTPVYLALGIPMEGIVLTNVVDTIPDLFKTTLNVSGNLTITAVVSGHQGKINNR